MASSAAPASGPSALAVLMSRAAGAAPPAPRAASRLRDQTHDAQWTQKRATKKEEEKVERARKAALKAAERATIRSMAEQAVNRELLRTGWADAPPGLDPVTLELFDEALLAPPPYHGNSSRQDKDAIKEAAIARGGRASFDRASATWYVEDRRTMLALMKTGLWCPVVLDGDNPCVDTALAHLVRQLERLLAPRHGAAPSAAAPSGAAAPAPKRPRPSDVPADTEEDLDSLEALGVPRGAAPLLAELPSTVLGPHAGISAVARVVRALRVGPLVASHVEMHYARHVEGVLTTDEFRRRVCGTCA
jgi:hypothetical protein